MSKAGPLARFGKFLSKAGKKLIQENEEKIESSDDNFNKIPSFGEPYDGDTTLERELNNLAKLYNEAKHILENGLYDPRKLTFVEKTLINRSKVTFNAGFYADYVFKTYSNGRVFVLGPKEILIPGPNKTLISKDKSINPLRHTALETVYAFMSIECIHPRACLRDLAMQSEYFAKFISKEDKALLEKYICDLADKL